MSKTDNKLSFVAIEPPQPILGAGLLTSASVFPTNEFAKLNDKE